MPIRVSYKIQVSVSSTSAEERDLGNANWSTITDSQNEGGTGKALLPAGATDQEIFLLNVSTIRFLIIRTTAKDPTKTPSTISIKRNGVGNESIEIKPLGTSKEGHLLISTDSLTSLHATNPGTVDMELTLVYGGD
jgi:hypothetical protein